MSNYVTPMKKGKFGESSGSSPWKTPSKGKPSTVKGYIILVGYEQTSGSNNQYFDVIIQQTKTDIVTVRVMPQNQKTVSREEFLKIVGTNVVMEQVFSADDMYFYKPLSGSSHKLEKEDLSFKCDSYRKFTQGMDNPQEKMNVECRLKYIGEPKFAANGSRIRNCVLYTEANEILATIWNPTYFDLPEDKMVFIGDLFTEPYFGVKAKLLSRTNVMLSGSELITVISKERLDPIRVRALGIVNTTEIAVKGIIGASFTSIIHCPAKNCSGQIQPPTSNSKIGKCSNYDKCKQMVNIDLAKYVLSGEITITNDVTLTADAEVVDSVFGDGVSALHNAQPDKITEKFLELRNISVLYDKKSSRLVAIEQK